MAELFSATKQNIAKHLKAIFAEQELSQESVVNYWLTTAADGKKYRVAHYNLDAILAVGYRVRSPRGAQFRRWASTVLKEYLLKGFAMDDERLKNPDGRPIGARTFVSETGRTITYKRHGQSVRKPEISSSPRTRRSSGFAKFAPLDHWISAFAEMTPPGFGWYYEP